MRKKNFEKIFAEYDSKPRSVDQYVSPYDFADLIDYLQEETTGTPNGKARILNVDPIVFAIYCFRFGYISCIHSMKYQAKRNKKHKANTAK